MGLSNQIPSSRLIQAGVCTSSTRPASPFEGQAIFETDTDRMLIWNGSAWVGSAKLDSFEINSSGYISMPNQPIISGEMGTSGSITGDQLVPFETFWVNRGITYNSSTRRFTVPATGIYRITMNPFFQSGTGGSRILVGIDTDSPTAASNRGQAYRESATYDTVCLNSVVSLNANSYIVFRLLSGTLYNASNDRFNQFSIEKIA